MSCCKSNPIPPVTDISGATVAAMSKLEFPMAQNIRQSMPVGMVDPKIHDDGSIEYTASVKIPPAINGYERDADNPRLFHPLWPICLKRLCGVHHKDGMIDLTMLCVNSDCTQHFKRQVTNKICQTCPLQVKSK